MLVCLAGVDRQENLSFFFFPSELLLCNVMTPFVNQATHLMVTILRESLI